MKEIKKYVDLKLDFSVSDEHEKKICVVIASKNCSTCKHLLKNLDKIQILLEKKEVELFIYLTPVNINSDLIQKIMAMSKSKFINLPTVVFIHFKRHKIQKFNYLIDNLKIDGVLNWLAKNVN